MAGGRGQWAYGLLLAAFFALGCLHFFSGYADNGDFVRSVGFIMDRPLGFSAMWPEGNPDEWSRRFYSQWHDRWLLLPDGPNAQLFSFSIYKVYLLVQVGLSILISGDASQYSMVLGSLLSRVLVFLSFTALVWRMRRRQPPWIAWGFALALAIVYLDAGWMAFLNSFYEEQVALILLPFLALSLLRFLEARTPGSGLVLLACGTLMALAKTAYFYLPLLLALFIFPFLKTGRGRATVLAGLCLCQALACTPVAMGRYGHVNAYHAVYFGALKVMTPQELEEVGTVGGKRLVPECVGISAFNQGGMECLQAADVGYREFVRLLASDPSIALRMAGAAMEQGRQAMDHLGKNLAGAPQFSNMRIFNLLPWLFARGFNLLALALLLVACALALAGRKSGDRADPTLMVGIFLAVFGFSQYAMALGDGFFEIKKHLIIGNYALTLAFPFTAAALQAILPRVLAQAFSRRHAEVKTESYILSNQAGIAGR